MRNPLPRTARVVRAALLAAMLLMVAVPSSQASSFFAAGAPYMPPTGKSIIGPCAMNGDVNRPTAVGCARRDHTQELLATSTAIAASQNYLCGRLETGKVRCTADKAFGAGAPYWTDDLPSGATTITAGRNHACALLGDHTVQCWGSGWLGQLGNGGTSAHTAVTVDAVANAVAIDAGEFHTCALIEGGTVKCWGAGTHGELGDGATANRTTAVQVQGLSDAIAISAGGSHTCATRASQDVVCWGGNAFGQLGDGTTTSHLTPVAVEGLGRVTQIAAGRNHTCAIRADDPDTSFTIACWGNGASGQLGVDVRQTSTPVTVPGIDWVAEIDASDNSTCAVSSTLQCWGAAGIRASTTYGATRADARQHDDQPTGATDVADLSGVTQLSAASRGTCARKDDATVACWGSTSGGIGRDIAATRPVPVPGIAGADQVDLADEGGCALISGRARCWFLDANRAYAERTLGGATPYTDVVDIDRTMDAEDSTGGGCLVRAPGTLWCWAKSPTESNRYAPVAPKKIDGVSDAKHVTRNADQVCVLLGGGEVRCADIASGDGTIAAPAPIGISDATALSAGHGFTCALRRTGAVRCWGDGSRGQLGDGQGTHSSTPVTVDGLTDAVAISAGGNSACAVLAAGAVRCWGADDAGQLGDGGGIDRLASTEVSGVAGAATVAVSWQHACVVRGQGIVTCWGVGTTGALGDGPAPHGHAAATLDQKFIGTPAARIRAPVRIIGKVAVGRRVLCDPGTWDQSPQHPKSSERFGGITMHPTPWSFSYTWTPTDPTPGSVGQQQQKFGAPGVPTDRPYHVVTQDDLDQGLKCTVSVDNGWDRAIATSAAAQAPGTTLPPSVMVEGSGHACWIGVGLRFGCFGPNRSGENGAVNGYAGPAIQGPFVQVAAGDRTSCVLNKPGTVWCWGLNNYGQVGDGTTTNAYFRKQVVGVSDVAQIAVGDRHTCALRRDGHVLCWGLGSTGRLGDGGNADSLSPVLVSDLSDAISISAAGRHTCAVRAGGQVVCWGAGADGRLGNGSTDDKLTPAVVSGVPDAIQVVAGGNHTCALRAYGSIRCWGDNTHGQIGDGTTTDRLTPVPVTVTPDGVAVGPPVVQLSAGGDTSCALIGGGTVSCWGDGSGGRLGGGSTGDRQLPTPVSGIVDANALTSGIGGSCVRFSGGDASCWGGPLFGSSTAYQQITLIDASVGRE